MYIHVLYNECVCVCVCVCVCMLLHMKLLSIVMLLSVLDKEKGQLFVSDKSGATFTLSLDNHMVRIEY